MTTGVVSNSCARFLHFKTRGRSCAIELSHLAETLRPLPVSPMAGMPEAVLGVATIRGEAVPVVDLAALLDGGDLNASGRSPSRDSASGRSPSRDSASGRGPSRDSAAGRRVPPERFVVLKAGSRRVALAVERVEGVVELEASSIQSVPPLVRDLRADLLRGLAARDGELVAVLQAARLLPEADR